MCKTSTPVEVFHSDDVGIGALALAQSLGKLTGKYLKRLNQNIASLSKPWRSSRTRALSLNGYGVLLLLSVVVAVARAERKGAREAWEGGRDGDGEAQGD